MLSNFFKSNIVLVLIISLTNASKIFIRNDNLDNFIRQQKAQDMLKYMNQSVDPCDDFYEFACGKYALYNQRQAMISGKVGVLDSITLEVGKKLMSELAKDDETDNEIDKKVKNFYKSCINTKVNLAYAYEVQQLPDEFGGMPVLKGEKWQENDFVWWKTLAAIIEKTGLPILFKINVLPDLNNNTIPRVAIEEPTLPLGSQKAYEFESARVFLTNNIALNLRGYLGVESSLAVKTAEEIFEFEKNLAVGLMDFNETQYKTMMSVLSKDEVNGDVMEFFQIIMQFKPLHVMVQHKYMDNAMKVLQRTPKRIVANYIFYIYLAEFMLTSSTDAEQKANACKDMTWRHFHKNLHNMLYRKYPAKEAEEAALKMWKDLKQTFEKKTSSNDFNWVLDETLKLFLIKLNAMELKINSFEEIDFVTQFNQFNPNQYDYLANFQSLLSLSIPRLKQKLEVTGEYDAGTFGASTPLYNPFANRVQMATTYLQSNHIWSKFLPSALNYATLGFTLAHEMTHGFDDIGMHHDAQGNSHDWWDSTSSKEFRKRQQCFLNQYHKFIFYGHSLPAIERQSENIADNGGLHLAYETYKAWFDTATLTQQTNENLPGFEYTDMELFFIGYGQSLCSYWNPVIIDFILAIDHHSPEKSRVNVALSNYEEFSKTFKCPIGSHMNPVEKCKMYG